MKDHSWVDEFPGAVTVCDKDGIIIEMNRKAAKTFENEGGSKLIGTSLLECHSEPSRSKLAELLRSRKENIYTIEKNGIKKLIYQSPWFADGVFGGLVELSLEIPFEMPHFLRK